MVTQSERSSISSSSPPDVDATQPSRFGPTPARRRAPQSVNPRIPARRRIEPDSSSSSSSAPTTLAGQLIADAANSLGNTAMNVAMSALGPIGGVVGGIAGDTIASAIEDGANALGASFESYWGASIEIESNPNVIDLTSDAGPSVIDLDPSVVSSEDLVEETMGGNGTWIEGVAFDPELGYFPVGSLSDFDLDLNTVYDWATGSESTDTPLDISLLADADLDFDIGPNGDPSSLSSIFLDFATQAQLASDIQRHGWIIV